MNMKGVSPGDTMAACRWSGDTKEKCTILAMGVVGARQHRVKWLTGNYAGSEDVITSNKIHDYWDNDPEYARQTEERQRQKVEGIKRTAQLEARDELEKNNFEMKVAQLAALMGRTEIPELLAQGQRIDMQLQEPPGAPMLDHAHRWRYTQSYSVRLKEGDVDALLVKLGGVVPTLDFQEMMNDVDD